MSRNGNDGHSNFSIVDILDHPRFPIYKNAITSLYRTQERDWLEGVFYHALGRNVGHAAVGALILVHELEPYSEYTEDPAVWQLVRKYLIFLSDQSENEPEQGLFLPAYLAHAIAFSHLPELRILWTRMCSRWSSGEHQNYLLETSRSFKVPFESYPLSYLLGLFEALLEPVTESEVLEGIHLETSVQRPLYSAKSKGGYQKRPLNGFSFFYIEEVEAYLDTSDSQARNSQCTILLITICLWENNLEQESPVLWIDDVRRLLEEYSRKLQRLSEADLDWVLLDRKSFEEQITQPSSRPYGRKKEFFDTKQDGNEQRKRYLSPRAYAVLHILNRFKEFDKCFTSEILKVKIKFSNIYDDDDNAAESLHCVYPDDFSMFLDL
jgi:hypothetical protein